MRGRGQSLGVVDFGSRDIRVLIARRDQDGTIQVIGHGTEPARGCISQGVVQDLGAAQAALKKALDAAQHESRVRVASLFCSVNGKNVDTHIREGNVKLDREVVESRHMEEALDIASRDILAPGMRVSSSITSQEWYVDDMRVKDPVGIRGHVLKVRVHFAVIPTVIEDNLVSCIESQHRDLEDFIFTPLAAAQGCLAPEDMECGVGVLDMGRTTTGLAVFRDYRVLGTHCFEWGGYQITRDVAAGLQVSFEEANELVLQYGISEDLIRGVGEGLGVGEFPEDAAEDVPIKLNTAVHGAASTISRRDLEVIIFERAKELMTKVRDHLFSRGLMRSLIRGMVLTGGGATLKNYVQLAEVIFQVPCRLGLPNSLEIVPHEVKSAEFSAAVGLVRHAFEYIDAAQNGRADTPAGQLARRLSKVFKKYFF